MDSDKWDWLPAKLSLIVLCLVGIVAVLLTVPLAYRLMTSFEVTVRLNNQSGLTVAGIRLAEPGAELGPNVLATPIPTGRIVRVPHIGHSCRRDVRVIYSTGDTQDFPNVDGCATTDLIMPERGGLGAGFAANPSFNVLNQGTRAIMEIYVSSITANGWGPNRFLAGRVMEPGTSFPIYLPTGGCNYDIKVVFADGVAQERRNVDGCRITFMAFP